MCGIVGFTGSPNKTKLDLMLNCIVHRGPDDDAGLQSDNFTFGMRRLAIIDLTADIYPMPNEKKDVFCVLNGEIYNYQEVREELKELGHKFKTESDSEVIVHGYEEWGTDVLSRLRGMFAFVVYDKREERMFVARDRLGIKPVYYANVDNRLVFASEIKALFAAWDIDRSPNDRAVYRFLLHRLHDTDKDTFFREVKRLLPGHFMVIEADGNYRTQQYWYPEVNSGFASKKDDATYAEELRAEFMESMRLHLISDVPVGLTLSGGLDSSAVAGAAAYLLSHGTDLHTGSKLLSFSAIHPGEGIDEEEYIDSVIEFTGATPNKIIPSVDKFWEEIDTWMYVQEEPTISSAPYAYYTVMREAGKQVTVLLSGQGGDELFAGYVPYFMSYVTTAADANAFLAIMRETVKGFDIYKRFFIKKLKAKLQRGQYLEIDKMVTLDKPEILSSEERNYAPLRNLNERLRFDVTVGSIPNLLRYEDKNSMAHSIESRVPFLDHKFVEYVLQLPADQKIKHGWNRYVYRNAMQGLMPEKNRLRRNKVGFINNEWYWLKEKRTNVLEIFESDSFRSRPYWNAEKIIAEFKATCDEQRHGDPLIFWRILCTELWLHTYVDNFKQMDFPLSPRVLAKNQA